MSTFLLVFGIYLIGAFVAWRVTYSRVYGSLYRTLAGCDACVRRGQSHGSSLGCYGLHNRQADSAYQMVLWIVLAWPFVGIGWLMFKLGKLLFRLVNRLAFPRGNRNRGYLAWTQAKDNLEYNTKAKDLRHELRRLGIDPEAWMPRDLALSSPDVLSRQELESQGWVLGRKLEEVSMSLRAAKEIMAMELDDSTKRHAIETVLIPPCINVDTPRHHKTNVRPDDSGRHTYETSRVLPKKTYREE